MERVPAPDDAGEEGFAIDPVGGAEAPVADGAHNGEGECAIGAVKGVEGAANAGWQNGVLAGAEALGIAGEDVQYLLDQGG